MNKKVLWVSWYSLLLLCALYGLLPEPRGFWKVTGIVLSVGAFVPAGLLIKCAYDTADTGLLRLIRKICIVSLSLTVALYTLNIVSTLMPPVWGVIFHILLAIGSTPMFCAQYWVISLFCWSCLLWSTVTVEKELKGK